uniref:Cadherin domain-containing protein n=1 Tax=Macrostomum lignano TaxID=282301 RepID=A0A1I8F250_9PLAT
RLALNLSNSEDRSAPKAAGFEFDNVGDLNGALLLDTDRDFFLADMLLKVRRVASSNYARLASYSPIKFRPVASPNNRRTVFATISSRNIFVIIWSANISRIEVGHGFHSPFNNAGRGGQANAGHAGEIVAAGQDAHPARTWPRSAVLADDRVNQPGVAEVRELSVSLVRRHNGVGALLPGGPASAPEPCLASRRCSVRKLRAPRLSDLRPATAEPCACVRAFVQPAIGVNRHRLNRPIRVLKMVGQMLLNRHNYQAGDLRPPPPTHRVFQPRHTAAAPAPGATDFAPTTDDSRRSELPRPRAEDADNIQADASAGLEYEAVNSVELGHRFSVDRASGLVLVGQSLRRDTGQEFQLRVRACDTRQLPRRCSAAGLYRVIVETDDVAVVGVGNWRSISESGIRNHPQAQPPSHVGGGGFGSVGASETVIACLSAMLLLLGAAVVIIVCVLVRRRPEHKCRRSSDVVEDVLAPGAALAAASLCDGASSLDAGQFEMNSISTKMIPAFPYDRAVTESYQDYPDWAEDDFDTSKSNGMRLKLPGTAVYTAHRRATTDRNAGSRYYTTSPAIGSNSEYQSLDAPRLRFPWQPMGSAEAPARLLHLGGLRANPELADSGAAAASATLPRNFRRRADHNDQVDKTASVYFRLARRRPLCPFNEAS